MSEKGKEIKPTSHNDIFEFTLVNGYGFYGYDYLLYVYVF